MIKENIKLFYKPTKVKISILVALVFLGLFGVASLLGAALTDLEEPRPAVAPIILGFILGWPMLLTRDYVFNFFLTSAYLYTIACFASKFIVWVRLRVRS